MSLLHDPFADQDEMIGISGGELVRGVSMGDFVPYMRGVGNIAGAFMGGGSKGQPAAGTLGAPAQANAQVAQLLQAQLQQAQNERDQRDKESAARTKTLLIIGGAVLGLGALGTLVYFLSKK